jgi:hypothetical protein
MFHVTTVNLSTDTTAADIAHGSVDVGEMTAEEFASLLERFRQLDPVQNSDFDPQLLVTAPAGKFRIRTGQAKLFLYDARDSLTPYAELTAEEIVCQLELRTAPAATDATTEPSAAVSTPSRGIAVAILLAGLALNGYTLYSVFYTETVNEKPAITLLTDPAEISAHQSEVVGTFATGDQPGDRTISVDASGKIGFSEIGARGAFGSNTDTFRLGRLGKNYCLTTVESGVVEVLNIDTLVYYRDAYKRAK